MVPPDKKCEITREDYTSASPVASNGIGTLQETSLHAGLKAWYTQPGDVLEAPVDGYWVDVVRGEHLIEIQTGNFSSIKRKLARLLENHPVRLVYPVAREKWIVRVAKNGEVISRRKSPKRGQAVQLFQELVRIPHLVAHPNFTLEVAFVQEEEVWRDDGRGSWRRKRWSIADRRLLAVLERLSLASPQAYRQFLPPVLPATFTVRDLAAALGQSRHLAGKMVYCLRVMGVIEAMGKRGRAVLYGF